MYLLIILSQKENNIDIVPIVCKTNFSIGASLRTCINVICFCKKWRVKALCLGGSHGDQAKRHRSMGRENFAKNVNVDDCFSFLLLALSFKLIFSSL
jgi:hypothetical protein